MQHVSDGPGGRAHAAASDGLGRLAHGLEQLAHRKEARKTIARLLGRCSALEAKWLTRLFLRDLKIGAESWVNTDPRKLTLVKLVLNAYSDGLFDFYTHRGDVRVAVRAAQAVARERP